MAAIRGKASAIVLPVGFPQAQPVRGSGGGVLRRRVPLPLAIGTLLLLLLLLAALAGPLLAAYPPEAISTGAPISPPDRTHWFGTDALGRDLFSRVIAGLRVSLWISLAAAAITALPGIVLGLLAGYVDGWLDEVLSRLVDVLLSLPGMLLAIVLIARLGPSVQTTIIALGITGIPIFYRVTRSETRSVARLPFVEASHALGMSGLPLILRHIFPNVLGPLLVLCSMRLGTYLLMSSGLSFIGLGVQPPQAELGALLAAGKEYYDSAWWLAACPGLLIVLAVLGFNLFGEGLRDRLA